jgi:predicted DNA-binding WGR domain protein
MPRRILQLPLIPEHWRWLEFQKIEPPNAKRFYRIEIAPTANGWAVVTYRGRIGQHPRALIETFASHELAVERALKRAHDRLLHGYSVTGYGV